LILSLNKNLIIKYLRHFLHVYFHYLSRFFVRQEIYFVSIFTRIQDNVSERVRSPYEATRAL